MLFFYYSGRIYLWTLELDDVSARSLKDGWWNNHGDLISVVVCVPEKGSSRVDSSLYNPGPTTIEHGLTESSPISARSSSSHPTLTATTRLANGCCGGGDMVVEHVRSVVCDLFRGPRMNCGSADSLCILRCWQLT